MLLIHAADEAIWHFIGIFHITDEIVRLRINYEALDPNRPDFDPGHIIPKDLATVYPFEIPDFVPGLDYTPPVPTLEGLTPEAAYLFVDVARDPIPFSLPSLPFSDSYTPTVWNGPTFQTPVEPPDPPPPPRPEPPEPPTHEWELPVPDSVALYNFQQSVLYDGDLVLRGDIPFGVDGANAPLQVLYDQAGQLGVSLPLELPSQDDAFLAMAQLFRDAEAPDDLPEGAVSWTRLGQDVLGKYQDGLAVDERPDLDALLPAYSQERQDEDWRENTTQHEVVVGHNMLVNEANITSAWIAAPVLTAAQGVYSYTIISQVNVWSDLDRILSPDGALNVDQTPTNALNFASYSLTANPAAHAGGDGDAPQFWLTATLEGSLVSVNWIDQYNFISDDDITSFTLHGDQTLLLIGDNGAVNHVSLAELGSQFDLIIIDGYILNLNAILQTNVMLDNDSISMGAGGGRISSGDNLLVNDATINQIGRENFAGSNDAYDAMMRLAADGRVILPASILNDPAFEGLDVLRVLHIKGDLVSVNMIRQTNVLGDADQIETYLSDAQLGGDVRVVTGSNTLVNTAQITEFGVDATIHSGGGYYSDALLHQAELVTDRPLQMGDGPAPLASEAVLFLADGMLTQDDGDRDVGPLHHDGAVPADIMETVLA
ncbi:hypothetical protein ACEUZ9_000613 [Paracoccus litorisediminis]|uniref:Type I secretion protein n=1 Tax=Paracoccus litorisediminis TaxID=2006130 RepID=A0A844HK87_9RHOB|nr:hypothetical protein [Paracoccus litorisediminis]MTH59418.1 hypothetical protein [Paracoccus litorisediminis]